MKPLLGCTNGALWVALARMLDEELTPSVSESQVNKCRAWLLAEFLRSELECKEPGCTGKHRRDYQIISSLVAAGRSTIDEYAEPIQ